MTAVKRVAIWTDSMGTYQARCLDCPWKSPWRRKEAAAIEFAKAHFCPQFNDGTD